MDSNFEDNSDFGYVSADEIDKINTKDKTIINLL